MRSVSEAGDETVKITLFRGTAGAPCYLPRSKETLAAAIRAVRLAKATGASVCLVDPDDP